jgi:hypothetical protein
MTIKDSSEFNGIMYNFANRGKIIEWITEDLKDFHLGRE